MKKKAATTAIQRRLNLEHPNLGDLADFVMLMLRVIFLLVLVVG